jgi:hypothetical protein
VTTRPPKSSSIPRVSAAMGPGYGGSHHIIVEGETADTGVTTVDLAHGTVALSEGSIGIPVGVKMVSGAVAVSFQGSSHVGDGTITLYVKRDGGTGFGEEATFTFAT